MRQPCFYLLILFLLTPVAGCLLAQTPDAAPPVNIPNTEELHLHSDIAAQDYVLKVNLPGGYAQSTESYPVIYLLDGQWDFPLVSAVYGEQYFDGFIPGMITVGITWGGEHPNYDQLRARDYTPSSPDGSDRWGHAAKFLSFIKQELIPFIESKYRTVKNERTLMGSSLGGLFTLYAMFNETATFDRYVLTSPAFSWDNGNLFNYEKDYAQKRSELPVRLFMGIGGLEPGVHAFETDLVDHFKAAKYKGLKFETLIVDNVGHSGSKAEGYARGLQWVFARSSLKVDQDKLDKYTGAYTGGMDTLRLVSDKGHLAALMNGMKVMLEADTETDFYLRGMFFNLHFKVDDQGKAEGARLDLYGHTENLKKIPQ